MYTKTKPEESGEGGSKEEKYVCTSSMQRVWTLQFHLDFEEHCAP